MLDPGERWRVITGDCLEVLRGMPDGCVDAVVTDPPYSSGGQFRGDRTRPTASKYLGNHGDISATMELPEVVGDTRDGRSWAFWATIWLTECLRVTKPGGLCAVFTDWRQLPYLTDAIQAGGWVWRGVGVWDKMNARPMSGRYSHQAEYFVWGTAGAIGWDFELPCGRGVYSVPAPSASNREHQTEKPVELLASMFKIIPPDSLILDPFTGSGSCGVACQRTGHRFLGVEISDAYADIARRRIAAEAAQGTLAFGTST